MPRPRFPDFSRRLGELLERRGVTNVAEFARSIGVGQQKMSRWRNGSMPQKQEELERLAAALRVPWQWLLVGDECAEELLAYRKGEWRQAAKKPPPPGRIGSGIRRAAR